jgi:glycosyltransferase involved in cell wall biosynthesis
MGMLCVVDNALRNFIGHHYEYSRCLQEAAARHNEPILILGHRNPEPSLAKRISFEHVFRRSHYDFITTTPVVRDLINPTVQNYLFFQDLRTSLKERVQRDWIVFTPAMNHNHVWGWAAWAESLSPQQCPTLVLFVRNSYCMTPDENHYDKRAYFAWVGFKWLERLVKSGRRVRVVTDSERLAAEFSKLTRLPMPIMPTPHTDRIGSPREMNGAIPRFVWLGGIRKDKGFHVLARAIRSLEPDLRASRLEMVIQSNLDDPNDRETGAIRDSLKSASLPGVTFIEKALTSEEYTNLLTGASAVLLPRLLQLYRSQTSGPFVEALAAGKPVVVTNNSWMSDQLKQHGAGTTFKDQDSDSLAEAIRMLTSNYDDLRQRAERSAKEWTSFHNPDRLYEMIQGLAHE